MPFKSRFWSESTQELGQLGFNLKWLWTSYPLLQKKFRNRKWMDSCLPNRSYDFLTKRLPACSRILLLSSKLSNRTSSECWCRIISTTLLCPNEVLPIVRTSTTCSLRLSKSFGGRSKLYLKTNSTCKLNNLIFLTL